MKYPVYKIRNWKFDTFDMECFSHLQVRLLKKYPGLKIGTKVWLQPMPHGKFYLGMPDARNQVFEDHAEPGVHFEYVFPTVMIDKDYTEHTVPSTLRIVT